MRRSGLGENMLKSDQNGTRNKVVGGNPEITDKFVDRIVNEIWEGVEPLSNPIRIFGYKGKEYKINKDGQILSLDGKIMKPFFSENKRGPRVRVKKMDKNGKVSEGEISVLKQMGLSFGPHIKGYHLMKDRPKEYILVPIDGDYRNMKRSNLQYIPKSEYGAALKILLSNYLQNFVKSIDKITQSTNKEIADIFGTTPKYVQKVEHDLANKGKLKPFSDYQKLQANIGIEFTGELSPIYLLLLEKEGHISNMEVVQNIYPNELEQAKLQKLNAETEEEKSQAQHKINELTNKVVRIRKRMTDKGLIPRFNIDFENKRNEAIEMIKNKSLTGYTNKKIAEILGLKKTQIDNLAKTVKK